MTPFTSRLGHLPLLLIAAALVAPASLRAQDSTGYRPFPSGRGARYAALGDISASGAFNANTLYGNPAALSFLESRSLAMSHYQDAGSPTMSECAAYAFSVEKQNTFGAGATFNHARVLTSTATGKSLQLSEFGADIAYARNFTPTFSLGGRIGVSSDESGARRIMSRSWSVGAFYQPEKGTSYGISYSGGGTAVALSPAASGTEIVSEPLPRSFRVGATLQFPTSMKQRIFVLALENEKFLGVDGAWYKIGLELYPARMIALRAGYIAGPDGSLARYGAGLVTDHFEIDYAIAPNPPAENFHIVSLLIGI